MLSYLFVFQYFELNQSLLYCLYSLGLLVSIVNFTSFTPPPFSTEVSVPSLESAQSCICVLVVSILPLYAILIFDFRIVSTVFYFVFFILFQ